MNKKFVYVFTNYNNSHFTKQAVDSIMCQRSLMERYIVIVDNDSNEDSKLELKDIGEQSDLIDVIFNNSNMGYFPGLNVGIIFAREKYGPDITLIVGNNDLVFSNDFEDSYLSLSNDKFCYPVISPNIVTLDGQHQNPHVISGISKFRELIYDIYHLNYYVAKMIMYLAELTSGFTDRKDEEQYEIEQEIYQGYGACYILNPIYFDFFEKLPEDSFLMYEEFFLAKQLSEENYKVFYEPTVNIKHHCHASTGTLPGKYRWQLSKEAHKKYRKFVKFWLV
ncbi:glycosyltransferase [Vibrio cyclitrophicus]|uniref:glycosyltransferase n=1 Tax=Vibrio cyclitrophicus TaxID=47951 RepID=UPI00030B80E1|nr:glycosyltransferase [Vibrio cyclitrophicus]